MLLSYSSCYLHVKSSFEILYKKKEEYNTIIYKIESYKRAYSVFI